MTKTSSETELRTFLEAHPETRFMELLGPDMVGVLRGKRIGRDEFEKVFKNGVNHCGSAVVLDTKGACFEGAGYGWDDGDPDVRAHAVPGTLAPVPWATLPTAQVMLELVELDGSPYFLDPRQVLKRAVQPLYDLGLNPVMATELEFYLVEHDGQKWQPRVSRIPGSDLRQKGLQYAVFEDLDDVDVFLTDLDSICQEQNIPAGAALSEYAPGQFEVNLHHVDDPQLACDHAVLLKRAVKAAARSNDLAATFMAKPFAGIAGSGLHMHISLLDDDGKNVFSGKSKDGPWSDTLRHAIGGLAATMSEALAIFAINANSYRRYSLHSYVPSTPNWGPNHRGLAMRIPLSGEKNTRVEHRVSGADANPYLAAAAVFAGIHHGISNKVEPGQMVQEREAIDEVVTLPTRWPLAMDAFEKGEILRQYIGEEYHRLYGICRREESDRFHSEITDRDYEWYLRAV
ncbi:MAG: glutamine synthetase family protein [Xanthomonadales bacterium]|nr:glutamine synthetase family protein [Xanthomonadales bacterium]